MIKVLQKLSKTSWLKRLSLVLAMQMFAFILTASASVPQEVEIKGNVTDASNGESLIGVSIVIKGTTVGTITDIDGNYVLSASTGDVLVFNFMGYTPEEVTVANQAVIDMSLSTDLVGLDEVVVIGYGVQKKKLNTGATLNVKGEELQKLNTNDAMSSLQGISPGVSITSESGKPGAGTSVSIRGVGTTGDSQPLYVVDGVQVGNIDYLSPSDIESIDVLKDAASSAIYGSQASNGVILVTTKSGTKGADGAQISFDMYFGRQQVSKGPNMLGAKDYMNAMNEGLLNSGESEFDFSSVPRYDEIMAGTYDGTDWFDVMVNDKANTQSYALNISDGNERSTYAAGVSYLKDDGLLGAQAKPDYQRITARLNSNHILKKWNGLDGIVMGENITFTNRQNPNVATGDIYYNDVRNHNVASPLLPLYGDDGKYYEMIETTGFEHTNPTAIMEYNRHYNENTNNTLVGSAYLEVQPIRGLKVKSQFGLTNDYGSFRNWTPTYYQSNTSQKENDEVEQGVYTNYKWILTNTAAYNWTLASDHNFSIVVGQESQQQARELKMEGTNQNSLFQAWEYSYLSNVPVASVEQITMEGKDEYGWAMSSYFGRLSYDFKERYLFTAIVRRDGSSNFGSNNRYATFPSFSAGWIISEESFMQNTPWLSYLKLRGSWGQNGNQRIDPYQYAALIEYEGANYPYGPDKTNNTVGSQLRNLPNPDVKWETSEQTNIGLDFHVLNSRLQSTVEWYDKKTKDWLLQVPVALTAGAPGPIANGGSVRNTGVEASVKWNDQVGDFKYTIGANMAYNKNDVTQIDNTEQIIHGKGGSQGGSLWQNASESYRAEVGYPIGYFWGYETTGVAQSQDDIDNYLALVEANGLALNPNFSLPGSLTGMVPGDVMFTDLNQDGKINDDDKTMIGDPNADIIYGFQVSLEYKGFYFNGVGVGKAGQQVLMSYSSANDRLSENMTYDYYNNAYHETRNPTGTMPRLTSQPATRSEISDIHIYDANYFRISNLTLGYNFKNLITTDVFSDMRLYVTGQNLFTFTQYPGMDPEVGWGNNDDWASGVDVGLYPLAKTYMIGLSVKF